MRRAPDTGESTARIVRNGQERAWADLLPKLHAGGILKRDARTKRYYLDGSGSLTDPFVRAKVKAGELVHGGAMDWWKLASGMQP